MYQLFLGTLMGAFIAYFLDPEQGKKRRNEAQKTIEEKANVARSKVESYARA